ncbi:MAG: hypothetical protein N3G74_01370 [Candidatus Micrarchaeota archaeon]|nr:hypothetical protein [Candidatus Micrarchaeota archaeon]
MAHRHVQQNNPENVKKTEISIELMKEEKVLTVSSSINYNDMDEFLSNTEKFINLLLHHKGDLSKMEKEFPVASFGIEFVERAKSICKRKGLVFHEKILNTVKDAIHKSQKMNILQASVIYFMSDLLSTSESMDESDYDDLHKHFYRVKNLISKEYGKEW